MTMNQRLLEALGAAILQEKVPWTEDLTDEAWAELLHLAQAHNVLPLVLEAVYDCPAIRGLDPRILRTFQFQSIQTVSTQTRMTSEFLSLYSSLRQRGLRPLVVKGLVCRELYPLPDHRVSGDEDMLITEEDYPACHEAMTAFGMKAEGDRDSFEVTYQKPGTPLYIELHKHLFHPGSDAYGDLNRFFTQAHQHAIEITVQGVSVATMGHTDHLFYLICHAYKHFLHSGFGLRQVCDMAMYANAYGSVIDWNLLLENCKAIHGEIFAAALFRIGEKYFHFDPEKACYADEWQKLEVKEEALLEDILDSGVFGKTSSGRVHSSNITLEAVSAGNRGKKGNGLRKSLFPPASQLVPRFPYLKEKPWLLPVAWTQRIVTYGKEKGSSPAETIRIGNERVALLRQYGIIE